MIHPEKREVRLNDQILPLTSTEFKLLHFLVRHPGWVYTRSQLIDAAQGSDYVVTDRAIDVHIVSLRKKLGYLSDMLETVRGVGYRFREA